MIEVFDKPGMARKPANPRTQTKVREFGKLFKRLAEKYGVARYYKWFEPYYFAEYFGFSPEDKDIGYEVANMLKDEFGIVVKYCRVNGIHFRWYVYTKTGWGRVRMTWKNRYNIELPE